LFNPLFPGFHDKMRIVDIVEIKLDERFA
jgi:hypothetical protein